MLQTLDTIIAFVVILLGASLLITLLTQMISAFLGYRGTNLLWGVHALLSTIAPDLSKQDSSNPKLPTQAEKIATEVLKKPDISDSLFSKFADYPVIGLLTKRWKLASAITPQELVRSLSNVAQTLAATGDGKPTAKLIEDVLKQVNPEAQRNVKLILDTIKEASPNAANQMDKLVQELGTKIQGSVGKLESSFDTIMKRTSQRFATQMRIWTIVFAVLLAFGAHLNSFKIVEQLWTNPEMRSGLVSDKEAVLREASIVLNAQNGHEQRSSPSVAPRILADAMKKFKKEGGSDTAGLPDDLPRFYSLDDAANWLQKNLKVDASRQKVLVAEYNNFVLTELKGHAETIQQELAKSGFQLFPTPYPGLLPDGLRNWLGILVTAGLLSLGAPFWFNVLKSLSNLRPLVANVPAKQTTEPTQT